MNATAKLDTSPGPLAFRPDISDKVALAPLLISAVLFLGWVAITATVIYLGAPTERVLLISADAAVLLVPIIRRLINGTFDVFEPLLMASFALMSMMVFRPLSDIMNSHYTEHAYDISTSFTEALLVVLGANAAFMLGYESPLGRLLVSRAPRASTTFNPRVAATWATVISLAGLAIFYMGLAARGGLSFFLALSNGRTGLDASAAPAFEGVSGYVYNTIGFLVPGSSILFALWLRTKKSMYLVGAIVVLGPYLFFFIGSGSRSGVIGIIIALPFMWYAFRRRRPSLPLLAVCALVVGFWFSVQRDSRAEEGSRQGHALQEALADPVSTVLNLFRSDDDEMFDVIAQEVAVTPYWVPFHHGAAITDIFVRALPRNLFPNKPVEVGEQFFAIMEPQRYKHSHAGTAPSIVGTFYLDSGAITAVFWMFVMGVCLSAIWAYYNNNQGSVILTIALSALPATVLATARGDLPSLFSSFPFGLFPVLILFVLQRIKFRSPRPGSFVHGNAPYSRRGL